MQTVFVMICTPNSFKPLPFGEKNDFVSEFNIDDYLSQFIMILIENGIINFLKSTSRFDTHMDEPV
jgi:hypothetical protein